MVGEPGWERNVEPWCRGCEWQPFQCLQDILLPLFLGPQFSVKWEELPLAVAALAGWRFQRLALNFLALNGILE